MNIQRIRKIWLNHEYYFIVDYLATEFNIKSLNLLLYYAGGTHETSLLKNVLLIKYYIFLIV